MNRRDFLRRSVGAAAAAALAPFAPKQRDPTSLTAVMDYSHTHIDSSCYSYIEGRLEHLACIPEIGSEPFAALGRKAAQIEDDRFWAEFMANDAYFYADPYEALEQKRMR